MSTLMDDIKTTKDALDKARDESIISPRFYSTDYEAMDRIDITPVRAEWDAMMQEFRDDPNGEHFQRDEAFRARVADLEPELRAEFYDFLISSATLNFQVVFFITKSGDGSITQTSKSSWVTWHAMNQGMPDLSISH